MKLDIGCGPVKKDGFVGIDKYDYGQQIIRDVEKGLPFSDNTIEEINCSHFIEHITDWVFVFNEMWRVCNNNAAIVIRYPNFEQGKGFLPCHKTFYSRKFFEQITTYKKNSKAAQELEKEGFKAKFRLESFEEGVNDSTVILKCIK
jgi:ubiquinone/menaquinone biosynthesis C-methylase UbiE